MRLWSIHPKYLDSKGLVALWREGLLAKAVLEGKTKGYTNHPQLTRFKKSKSPIKTINVFLYHVWLEAIDRGYKFDVNKIKKYKDKINIYVNDKQIEYEFEHLQKKLKKRDSKKFRENLQIKKIFPNNIFRKKKGKIEDWEIL